MSARVLVLGGTNFIGRVLVEQLIQLPAYQLTLFNRGKRNPGLFPEVEQVHGDRETDDINKITNRNWDYVIDLSGYYPETFANLLKQMQGRVGRYIFVSTISVYNLDAAGGKEVTEKDEILPCSIHQKVSKLPDAYGEKKAEMERLLLAAEGLDKVILRPSLVYGRYDFTDRFYYWLWRARQSSRILLPDSGSHLTSLTYVDDLAHIIIAALQLPKHNTVYNAATHRLTLKQLVETAIAYFGTSPNLVSKGAGELSVANVTPWQDIALWTGSHLDVSMNKLTADFSPAYTPVADTVRQTAQYYQSLGWPPCKYGLSAEKEESVLG